MDVQTFTFKNLGLDLPSEQRFYLQMRLIRAFETMLLDLFSRNKLFGTTHTCIGQEANAVAVMEAIDRSKDMIFSNHRCHGHFLAYCGQVERLLAEIMGKSEGVCGGRGGSQHLHWGNFMSSGVQGGLVPAALGAAKAEAASGAISVVFLGDGTMGEGIIYECLNLAALWSLPVLFVVEDNGIAQTTPRSIAVSGSIARRAEPFGINSVSLDSSDIMDILPLVRRAVAFTRTEQKPTWLHIGCVRLAPHSKSDDTRSEDELEVLRRRDPLLLHGSVRIPNVDEIDRLCGEIINDALAVVERMT